MTMTSEQREQVATELKRFAGDLNLTEQQKEKLQSALRRSERRSGNTLRRTRTQPKLRSLHM